MPEKSIVKNQRFDNLNAEEEQTLITILNLVIPPSEDDKMPGAADIGFIDYIQNQNLISWIREGLINIFLRVSDIFSVLKSFGKSTFFGLIFFFIR